MHAAKYGRGLPLKTGQLPTEVTRRIRGGCQNEEARWCFRLLSNLVQTDLAQDTHHGAHRVQRSKFLHCGSSDYLYRVILRGLVRDCGEESSGFATTRPQPGRISRAGSPAIEFLAVR